MPSLKDVTPSGNTPHLAFSRCDIAVGTQRECSSSMPHPCHSPTPSTPWCLHRSVMNMSDLMTHVTIALTPSYSSVLPVSVNGLGVETADTVSMSGQICSVQIRLVLRGCLCVHCQSLSLTYTVLHRCTVTHAYFTCIYSIMHSFPR